MTHRVLSTAGIGLIVWLATSGCDSATPADHPPLAATTPSANSSCPTEQEFENVLNASIQMLEGMTSVEVVGDVTCADGWAVAPTRTHFANDQVSAREFRFVLRRSSETWELRSGVIPRLCSELPATVYSVACKAAS